MNKLSILATLVAVGLTGAGIDAQAQAQAQAQAYSPTYAQAFGTVVARTPVYAQVQVPQTQCTEQPVLIQQPPSGAGALLGALVGGGIGSAMGSGAGRAAATGLAAMAGAVIGDRAEAQATPPVSAPMRQCRSVAQLQNQLIGYDIVYDYQGMRYTARVASDPGERIALNVSVAPAGGVVSTGPVQAPAASPVWAPAPIYAAPPPAVYLRPAYVAPPIVFGWGGRHWR